MLLSTERLAEIKGRIEIKRLRLAKGLTTRQLAEMTGLTISEISDIEGGRTQPDVETRNRLAEALAKYFPESRP